LGVVVAATPVVAQDSIPRRLPPVTVTRDVSRSPLDLPFAISTTRPDSLAPGQAHTMVDQTLSLLPGVTVANRTNPSQDTRVSIRGFGARSAFGVRSIRVMRDGMPLTLPDGQTPIDYLDLESVSRVEAIRGTASALYGNASGGIIDLRSGDAPAAAAAVQGRSWAGSDNLFRYVGLFGGSVGAASYQGSLGRTQSDGYRGYAKQKLTNAFARATAKVAGTDVALVGMGLDMPLAQNPGAITRALFDTNPGLADSASVRARARKEVHQVQIGLSARRSFGGDGEVDAQIYGGTRSLYNPLTFAVVNVGRHQSGATVRATRPVTLGSWINRFSAGVDLQRLSDARKNWANCNAVRTPTAACATLPVEKGVLQLDQREIVSSIGPYVRDEVDLGRVHVTAGARADQIKFEVRDAFTADGRDDSGARTLRAVSPMAAVAVRLTPLHAAYANVSSAFETPTTTELGNQPDGGAGLNRDLKPQYSTTYEVGMKGFALSRVQYDVALFATGVRDELIQYSVPNGNGRMYFRNAGRTQRRGAEVQLATEVGPLSVTTAYTLSNFRFDDFVVGTNQYADKMIPGIPDQVLQTAATLRVQRAFVTAEGIAKGRVAANDANTAYAPGYVVANLRAGVTTLFGKPWLSPVIGLQNVFDTHYVGSVAINAAVPVGQPITAGKFYEPSPGRTWLIGLSAATAPW
jgi:iron complex outermembrane receptor protein